MSDDTPTQRLPEAGSDAPTKRLDTAPTAELAEEKKKSKALLAILISVGGALLIAIIILLIVVFGAGGAPGPTPDPSNSESASASPSPTPSDSPSPDPSPTPTESEAPPPPPSTDARINSFSVSNTTVLCNTSAQDPAEQYISFSWNTSNVDRVYFGVNTDDASTGAFFDNLPPSGNSQDDFPEGYNDFQYPCPSAQTKYTLTVVGEGGEKDSRSVTVVNNGDTE